MIDLGKRNVLGIGVNAIDYEAAVAKVVDAAVRRRPMSVTAIAAHGVMTGVNDREHRYRLNQFDLVCPDGQPVRWALNLLHQCDLNDRVYGPDLTLYLCKEAAANDIPIYLFGATDETLSKLSESLRARFPTLQIAGQRASRFRTLSETERDQLAGDIASSGAGLCFVGLGCPRQEVFAYEMRPRLNMPLIAVGAAFAFHAGLLPQAPTWMQRNGLEWAYRLSKEPGRLWKRYFTTNPAFLTRLAMQRMGVLHRSRDQGQPPSREVLFG